MTRRLALATAIGAVFVFVTVFSLRIVFAASAQDGSANESWTVPANAAAEKNPVESSPAVIKKALQIFNAKCERCHGSTGKGDGPDGDPDNPPADLSDPERLAKNPDGVMFYKIWNGRGKPKIPAFKTEMSRNDVWTVIHYVKRLSE
jgi:high-affinity iron transporter